MIDLPNFRSREEVIAFLGEIVQLLSSQRYFVTGSIAVDFKRTCSCGAQKVLLKVKDGEFEEICIKCTKVIRDVSPLEATNSKITAALPVEARQIGCDTSICFTCGGLAYRSGTCYVCHSCGNTSGCS